MLHLRLFNAALHHHSLVPLSNVVPYFVHRCERAQRQCAFLCIGCLIRSVLRGTDVSY